MRKLRFVLVLPAFVAALHAAPPPKPYHLELEANPATSFPYLGRFGTVTLHIYPDGVRAETFWLSGFTRNGTSAVTVENPLGRMYTEIPLTQISANLRRIATSGVEKAGPTSIVPITGDVKGIPARRYRLFYGADAWIDVWTTDAIPENPQYRAIVNELVRGISPATEVAIRSIPGTPLYVELNFRRYKKVPLVRLKSVAWNSEGQDDALKTGALYVKAPLLDAVWK
jgi:hypothetical protein